MDYRNLTAACGRDCFNCPFYLANTNEKLRKGMAKRLTIEEKDISCAGCRNNNGFCKALKNYGFSGSCKIYECSQKKEVDFCFNCSDFPCELLHPLADQGDKLPHNMKIYNLCKIKQLGLENWAVNYAKASFDRYYTDKLDSCI